MITVTKVFITLKDKGKLTNEKIYVKEKSISFKTKKEMETFKKRIKSIARVRCGQEVDVTFTYIRLDYTPPYGLIAKHAQKTGVKGLNSKGELVDFVWNINEGKYEIKK